MAARVLGNLGASGEYMAAVCLVYLVGVGAVFGTGSDIAGVVVMFGVAGCVFVVSVVLLPLVLRWPCTLLALEMGLVLGLALVVFFGGRDSLSLGDGWPPGEGMAALCLVNLVGVRGVWWLAAAIAAPFASSAVDEFLKPSLLPSKRNMHLIN
jgi:hypothetical protein